MGVAISIDRVKLALANAKATSSWQVALRTDELQALVEEYDRLVTLEKLSHLGKVEAK